MARLARRALLGAGGFVILGAGAYAFGGRNLFYAALTEASAAQRLTAPEAHAAALAGEITLIDVRRPDEWQASGSGEGAIRLDMRREDFIAALTEIVGGDPSRPVALICARGVRSARMSNRLLEAGFTSVIDVPEGMFGSSAGPGWHARGLPVDRS